MEEKTRVVVTMADVIEAPNESHEELAELPFEDAASTSVALLAAQVIWLRLYADKELVSAALEIAEAALVDINGANLSTDTIQ